MLLSISAFFKEKNVPDKKFMISFVAVYNTHILILMNKVMGQFSSINLSLV